jgi:hypothetical protein
LKNKRIFPEHNTDGKVSQSNINMHFASIFGNTAIKAKNNKDGAKILCVKQFFSLDSV